MVKLLNQWSGPMLLVYMIVSSLLSWFFNGNRDLINRVEAHGNRITENRSEIKFVHERQDRMEINIQNNLDIILSKLK